MKKKIYIFIFIFSILVISISIIESIVLILIYDIQSLVYGRRLNIFARKTTLILHTDTVQSTPILV